MTAPTNTTSPQHCCENCLWLRTRWRLFRYIFVCVRYQVPARQRCLDYTERKLK